MCTRRHMPSCCPSTRSSRSRPLTEPSPACRSYTTHKHPKVQAWLIRHPRWTFHFTPTSSSWLNAVENFFSALTRKRLRRGVFRSIVDLQAAINRYLNEHNRDPKPFVWTRPARDILAKLTRLPVPSV